MNLPIDSTPHVWAASRLYFPNFSGAAIQAHRILRELSDDFRIRVLSVADLDSKSLAGQTQVHQHVEVRYLRIVRRSEWKPLRRVEFLRRRIQYVHQLLSDLTMNMHFAWQVIRHASRQDVLLLYSIDEFSVLVILAARLKKVSSIIQMSLLGADDPGSFQISVFSVLTRLKLTAFKMADRVIGLSSALTESCIASGVRCEKVIRIPNCVDVVIFHPATDSVRLACRDRLGLKMEKRYITFIGSALQRKGIDVAVAAFLEVAKSIDDVDFLVVGNSDFSDRIRNDQSRRDLVSRLKADIANADLTNRVHWIGQVSNVDKYLKASDVFFFPTRREGLPNALAEAMACGLPVVAAHISGVTTDLVRNGEDGILVEGHETKDYADQLVRLLADEELGDQLGKKAANRMREEFSVDSITARYRELIGGLSRK